MAWSRSPDPRQPNPFRAFARTLADHHRDCAQAARQAWDAYRAGRFEVAIMLTPGDLLRLKFTPPVDRAGDASAPLVAYWMTYWEADGILRQIRPIGGEGA